jgi:hypothetical protein
VRQLDGTMAAGRGHWQVGECLQIRRRRNRQTERAIRDGSGCLSIPGDGDVSGYLSSLLILFPWIPRPAMSPCWPKMNA